MDQRMRKYLQDGGILPVDGETRPTLNVTRYDGLGRPTNKAQLLGEPDPDLPPDPEPFDHSYQHPPQEPEPEWWALGEGAVAGWVAGICITLSLFLGPWLLLPIPIFVSLTLYVISERAGRDQIDAEDLRQTMARNSERATERFKAWVQSRPGVQVATATDPFTALRFLMASFGATIYLGTYPDSRKWRVVRRDRPVLVIGPTRSGKTRNIIIPTILAHPGPIISTSTKRDVFTATYKLRAMLGTIWLFDPLYLTKVLPAGVKRLKYSLLWACRDWDTVNLVAAAMVDATGIKDAKHGDYWAESAKIALRCFLFAAAIHPETFLTIMRKWIKFQDFDLPKAILRIVANHPTHPARIGATLALEDFDALRSRHAENMSSLMTTLETIISVYSLESIQADLHEHNADLASLVRSRDTIYIDTQSEWAKLTAPLFVALISEAVREAKSYNAQDPFMESDRPPLLLALDEATQIAPLPMLMHYFADSAGSGIQCLVCVQNLPQAKEVWKDAGALFDGAIVAKGGISDKETLEALSVLCGQYDRRYTTSSTSNQSSTSAGTSKGTSGWSYQSGSNAGTSESRSLGMSDQMTIVRQMTDADISSLPRGYSLTIEDQVWQITEDVGVGDEPWAQVLASAPQQLSHVAEAPNRSDTGLPKLPSLEAIQRAVDEAKAQRAQAQKEARRR